MFCAWHWQGKFGVFIRVDGIGSRLLFPSKPEAGIELADSGTSTIIFDCGEIVLSAWRIWGSAVSARGTPSGFHFLLIP